MDILCSYDRPSSLPIPSPSTRIPPPTPLPFTQTAEQSKQTAKTCKMRDFHFESVKRLGQRRDGRRVKEAATSLRRDSRTQRGVLRLRRKNEHCSSILLFLFFSCFFHQKNNTECLTVRLHDLLWGTDHIPINLDLRNDGPWWVHREEWINVHVND